MFKKMFIGVLLAVGVESWAAVPINEKCFNQFGSPWSLELVNQANDAFKAKVKERLSARYVNAGKPAPEWVEVSEILSYRGVAACVGYSCYDLPDNSWAAVDFRARYFSILVYNKGGVVEDNYYAEILNTPTVHTRAEEVISPIGQIQGIQCSMVFNNSLDFVLTNAHTEITFARESIYDVRPGKTQLIPKD